MAGQKLTSVDNDFQVLEINSYVWGLPYLRGHLESGCRSRTYIEAEPSNYNDKHAVAVLKDYVIVGHVLYNLAACLS